MQVKYLCNQVPELLFLNSPSNPSGKVYDKKELELELSTIYGNINIKLVNDLNDVIFSKKNQFRIDTTFISINSIPYINNEDFNINTSLEIYNNYLGCLVKNHFSYNQY